MGPVDSSRPEEAAAPQTPLTAVLADAARQLLADARAIAAQQLQLLGLEARKAAQDGATMVALGAATGVLLALAWAGFTAACALWLMEQGTRTSAAVLLASCLNVPAGIASTMALLRLARAPRFPATLKSLGLVLPVESGGAP